MSQKEAIPQDALEILNNVLKHSSFPSIEVMKKICDETGLSLQPIHSWFVNNSKHNDIHVSAAQQEILESYLMKTDFVTKHSREESSVASSDKIAKQTSLKPKKVLNWFIQHECTHLKDNHLQILEKCFDHQKKLTKKNLNRLVKKTKLTPKMVTKWWVQEYAYFMNILNTCLDEPKSENNSYSAISQKGDLRRVKENGQWSVFNGTVWRTCCRVANCRKEKQSHQLCQRHFIIGSKLVYFKQQIDEGCSAKQKLIFDSKMQKLMKKSGHLNNTTHTTTATATATSSATATSTSNPTIVFERALHYVLSIE